MKVISARTTYPNTPESDRQPTVMHTVHWIDDAGVKHETQLMAACPLDASDRMRRRALEAPVLEASA